MDRDIFCDAIGGSTYGAGDIGAMAITVIGGRIVVDEIISVTYTSCELRMRYSKTAIDDIRGTPDPSAP